MSSEISSSAISPLDIHNPLYLFPPFIDEEGRLAGPLGPARPLAASRRPAAGEAGSRTGIDGKIRCLSPGILRGFSRFDLEDKDTAAGGSWSARPKGRAGVGTPLLRPGRASGRPDGEEVIKTTGLFLPGKIDKIAAPPRDNGGERWKRRQTS